jgi:hypothetical protein
MIKNLKRREAIKVAIAGGGLFALKSVKAEAGEMRVPTLAGNWQYEEQPCAIFQQGPVLLVVNQRGSLGTARMTDDKTFAVLAGTGWDLGLTGTLSDNGKTINWSNDSSWTRVK